MDFFNKTQVEFPNKGIDKIRLMQETNVGSHCNNNKITKRLLRTVQKKQHHQL